MSSTDSSEDEEEAKKINDAVIPNELLSSLASQPQSQPQSGLPIKTKPTEESERNMKKNLMKSSNHSSSDVVAKSVEFQYLKSKRSDKALEDEEEWSHAYALKTTPEFRAHVEKHLMNALDREIDASLRKSVWKSSKYKQDELKTGIKLFAGVKKLCYGETRKDETPIPRNRPKIKPRKHKMNPESSESSEEEKISSCVFSIDDIQHENQMLTNMSKSGVELPKQQSQNEVKGSNVSQTDTKACGESCPDTKPSPSKKKKKKKKEKQITNDAQIDSLNGHSEQAEELNTVKKKEKKSKIKEKIS